MMTIQQKIEENAKRGLFSVIQYNRTKEYQIILPIKNDGGYYRISTHKEVLEDCFPSLGQGLLINPQNLINYTYIKSLSFQDIVPIEPYKVGDRVDAEIDGINQFCVIDYVNKENNEVVSYNIRDKQGHVWLSTRIPLRPHFEEETPSVEQEAIELVGKGIIETLKKHKYKITKE